MHPIKIKFTEKISFGCLNFGQSLLSIVVSTYLLYYYTDILLLPAASVSLLLLIVRFFDGAIDPFIGFYMDKRKTKNGKFKKYILVCAVPFCLLTILLFAPFPGVSPHPLFYCYLIYLLWSLIYSIIEGASNGLTVSITADPVQRRAANTYKIIFSVFAVLLVSYFTLILVAALGNSNEQKGFFYTVILFSVIAAFTLLPAASLIQERNYQPSNHLNLRENISFLIHNKKLLLFLLMYFFHQIASAIKTQAAIYYFKYTFARLDMVSLFYLFGRIGTLSAQPFIVIFSKKFHIAYLMAGGYLMAGLSMLCVLFTDSSAQMLIILASISSVASAFPANLAFTYSADIADAVSAASHNSFSGLVSSLLGLSNKIGISAAGAVIALILHLSNYVPNAVQSGSSMLGIRLCFIVFSAVMYFAAGISIYLSYTCRRVQTNEGTN